MTAECQWVQHPSSPTEIARLRSMTPPPSQLFPTRQAAHDAMMEVVTDCLREARELDCFPGEQQFVDSMKTLWVECYSRYAPSI